MALILLYTIAGRIARGNFRRRVVISPGRFPGNFFPPTTFFSLYTAPPEW